MMISAMMCLPTTIWRIIMERFLQRHNDRILGTITGFDRVLFRGQLLSICHIRAMDRFLSSQHILYKHFSQFAQIFTDQIISHAKTIARKADRPYQYLSSSTISKEDFARSIMLKDNITQGLVCLLSCVEPCHSFSIHPDRSRKRLNLVWEQRKCLHLYFYYVDRDFGLMHIRLQTWFPFTIQVCINGREWLARQLDRAGIAYIKVSNCFTQIDDLEQAQQIANSFATLKLERILSAFARRVNPFLDKKARIVLRPYYWTMRQAEYATDLMFRDEAALKEVYPALLSHAIERFSSDDVMRFLGRRSNTHFSGEAKSSLQRRKEGCRVKHWIEENSIKMYDKAGSVLRVETTINNPKRFRVRRRINRAGQAVTKYLPMRKGIADLSRRIEVCRAANTRYLEAIAIVGEVRPSRKIFDEVSKRVEVKGRNYRALRPISEEESDLFRAIMRGENLIHGIRNQEMRRHLYGTDMDEAQRGKASARVSRKLMLLRAHGLIYKVAKTNYYRVTKKGHEVMSTAMKFRESDVALLAT
jgi:hypothetical protein